MKTVRRFISSQPVLAAAFAAALVTVFIVPPDREYIGYVNRTVLIQLFGLMTAVAGLRSAGIFDSATRYLLQKTGNIRKLGLFFVLICYFSAMIVTNDVALITFVPLTLLIYKQIDDEKNRILTIVLETIAANMGSMMTPVGNPQNLFLYDQYKLSAMTFLKMTLPAGVISLAILIVLTRLLPAEKCNAPENITQKIPVYKTAVYALLFVVCLLSVFRVIPDYICLAAAIVAALITEPKLLGKADYPLLLTFVCFFVFVGNIARISSVRDMLSQLIGGREILSGAILSQFISNVPAAVMLAGFTDNGTKLLLGVNIGGMGTLIASLASLISFQFYRKEGNAQPGKYMAVFSVTGFAMLALLLILCCLIYQ